MIYCHEVQALEVGAPFQQYKALIIQSLNSLGLRIYLYDNTCVIYIEVLYGNLEHVLLF